MPETEAPGWDRVGDWLVEVVDGCTCGSPLGPYGHEAGCGLEPLGRASQPWPRPDCCNHADRDEHGCHGCHNSGHAHDPALPCPPPAHPEAP